jgi:hypothetical protein
MTALQMIFFHRSRGDIEKVLTSPVILFYFQFINDQT